MLRFGLDAHPWLARTYAWTVLPFIPLILLVALPVVYLPTIVKTVIGALRENYSDAWEIASGAYHARRAASQAAEERK